MARARTAVAAEKSAPPPTEENFAELLDEIYGSGSGLEGSVIKGTIVSIENDFAIIDVGLKSEGRVPLREFSQAGRPAELKVGDTVDVYLDRVENAQGEAVLSRDKARREECWGTLEKALQNNE